MYDFQLVTNNGTLYLLLLDCNKHEIQRTVTKPTEDFRIAKARVVRLFVTQSSDQMRIATEMLTQAMVASGYANAIARDYLAKM